MDKEMNIIINNKQTKVEEGMTVSQLLARRNTARAAVFINGVQLRLAEYESRVLAEGDTVKILRIVSGG